MSELIARHAFDVYEEYTRTGDDDAAQVYLKSEVDKVIAELNDKLRHYPMMAALIEGDNKKIRGLKRALYKACANWALSTLAWLDCIDQGEPKKWSQMRQKCLAKVEEYK